MVTSLPACLRLREESIEVEDERKQSNRGAAKELKRGGGRRLLATNIQSLSAWLGWRCVPDWIGFGVLPCHARLGFTSQE